MNDTLAWMTAAPTAPSPPDRRRYIDPASGIRFYPIPPPTGSGEWLAVPGVTSILSDASSEEDRQRLENWRQQELAAGRDPNAGRDRGTRVHAALEDYIRGVEPSFSTDVDAAAFSGMEKHLASYSTFLWNERPLVQGWEHCWSAPAGDPDRLARVWSWQWGYAGTPDLIGKHRRGLTILGDFKTSNQPYYRCSGSQVPAFKRTGYLKFRKTVRQLCAYKLAVEEMLDLHIDALQIIVGLPAAGESQMFYISGPDLELETENFKQLAAAFWAKRASAQLLAA
jgi:hypothetical protein